MSYGRFCRPETYCILNQYLKEHYYDEITGIISIKIDDEIELKIYLWITNPLCACTYLKNDTPIHERDFISIEEIIEIIQNPIEHITTELL